jgi:hypothetical protein
MKIYKKAFQELMRELKAYQNNQGTLIFMIKRLKERKK